MAWLVVVVRLRVGRPEWSWKWAPKVGGGGRLTATGKTERGSEADVAWPLVRGSGILEGGGVGGDWECEREDIRGKDTRTSVTGSVGGSIRLGQEA